MTARMRWLACTAGLVVLATGAPAAQEKPDFSGRWVLAGQQSAVADIPSALLVRQSLTQTIAGGGPIRPFLQEISVDRQFEGGTRSETHTIGVLGGVVPGLRADGRPAGPISRHAVKWEGYSLVFESGSSVEQEPGRTIWAERREVWSLQPDGRLRVTIASRSAAGGRAEVTVLYRRP